MSRRRGERTVRRPALVALVLAALASILGPARAAAQETACDPGDTEVRALEFRGNAAFSDDQLAAAVVTTPSSGLRRNLAVRGTIGKVWGQRRCIDRNEVVLDRARLILFYRNRGYPDVQVDTLVRRDGRAIRVRFDIAEGRAIRVDTVRVTWLDSVPNAARLTRGLPLRPGMAFDKLAVEAARDTLLARLSNGGHPWAQVLAAYESSRETYVARVDLTVLPGPRTRIGRIDVAVTPRAGATQQIPDAVAKRLLGVEEGAVYRDRDLAAARRNLYLTEAYQNVVIERDSSRAATGADTLVNLRVSLLEGYMRAARASAGFGTIDCGRVQGDLTHRSFRAIGLSSRLEVTGRVSKIGVGHPLSGGPVIRKALCGQIQDDPYSDTLNYYTGITLRQPLLAGVPNVIPTITVFSLRQSEYKAFLREVPIGGVASYTRQRNPRLPQTVSYQLELGRTQAQPAVLCALFNACQADDREPLLSTLRTATLGYSLTRNRANDAFNPTRGSVVRIDLRHASRWILSDSQVQFNRALADVSWYAGSGSRTLALRLRAGGVLGNRISLTRNGISDDVPDFVPQQERLFAGGAQTVRGFRQNELGPLVYVANGFDAVPSGDSIGSEPVYYLRVSNDSTAPDSRIARRVPTGGNTLLVANLEYRFRAVLPDLLQFVLFSDFGSVWDRRTSSSSQLVTLMGTPGVGIRAASPFGPIRVDFGYNPHRPASGEVYYEDVTATGTRPLYCVSPFNRIPATRNADGTWSQQSDGASCNAGYRAPERSFWRRWNISLGIGQAF